MNVLNTTDSYITDGESENFGVKLYFIRERERKGVVSLAVR